MRHLKSKSYFNHRVKFDEVYRINIFKSYLLNKTVIFVMN